MAEAAWRTQAAGVQVPDAIVVAAEPREFIGDLCPNIATHRIAEVPPPARGATTSSGRPPSAASPKRCGTIGRSWWWVVKDDPSEHPRVSVIGRSIPPERSMGRPCRRWLAWSRALMAEHGVSAREIAQVSMKNHASRPATPMPISRTQCRWRRSWRAGRSPTRCGFSLLSIRWRGGRRAHGGTPTFAAGIRTGHGHVGRPSPSDADALPATQAAAAAYAMRALVPAYRFAEIHDAFVPFG
jgi:hypothetical protein